MRGPEMESDRTLELIATAARLDSDTDRILHSLDGLVEKNGGHAFVMVPSDSIIALSYLVRIQKLLIRQLVEDNMNSMDRLEDLFNAIS